MRLPGRAGHASGPTKGGGCLTDLRVPPDGAQPRCGAAVAVALEVALPVAPVDARRDHGVAEPVMLKHDSLVSYSLIFMIFNIIFLDLVLPARASPSLHAGLIAQYRVTMVLCNKLFMTLLGLFHYLLD